jgi:hypothetical protein
MLSTLTSDLISFKIQYGKCLYLEKNTNVIHELIIKLTLLISNALHKYCIPWFSIWLQERSRVVRVYLNHSYEYKTQKKEFFKLTVLFLNVLLRYSTPWFPIWFDCKISVVNVYVKKNRKLSKINVEKSFFFHLIIS